VAPHGHAAAQPADAPVPLPDIPLTHSLAPGREAVPASDLPPLPLRKTVVVVDDDPMMLTVLANILQRENFHLILAGSGPDAIRAIDGFGGSVDLLITDFAMPEMEGRELADRVRERIPTVKVLYQTGFSDLLFEHCVELEEGAAFVEKPFTARGLREAARLVLFGTLTPS
jgi:DNA-binding response OmpR family regulator